MCANSTSFAYRSSNTSVFYGSLSEHGELDPASWTARSTAPVTSKANVSEAFSWLDVRAAG
jgi:hypothetical protein